MADTLQFPSLEWLRAVREVFNSSDRFREVGSGRCDCSVGLKIEDKIFVIQFEGFGCTDVSEGDETSLFDLDFFLEMPMSDWHAMVANIHENGHAVGKFTLNSLDLNCEEGIAHTQHGDQYRQDLFVRYNQTLQFFFDASSRLDFEMVEN